GTALKRVLTDPFSGSGSSLLGVLGQRGAVRCPSSLPASGRHLTRSLARHGAAIASKRHLCAGNVRTICSFGGPAANLTLILNGFSVQLLWKFFDSRRLHHCKLDNNLVIKQ